MTEKNPATKDGCEKLLTRQEVAERCRVTPRSINKWTKQGILKPVRLPGRKQALGYRKSDIETLLTPRI